MKKRLVLTIIFTLVLLVATSTSIINAKEEASGGTSNGLPFQELRDAITTIQDELAQLLRPGDGVSLLENDVGYLTSETDPIYSGSAAQGITSSDIDDWDSAFGWGDHSAAGYLTVETDPLFSSSASYGIESSDIVDWSTAYSWGDHSTAGYLTAEADPFFVSSAAYGIQGADIDEWNAAFGWGDHSAAGYLTTETDPLFASSAAYGIQGAYIDNWNAAYGWGDHSAAGYLTAEADPLFSSSAAYGIQSSDIDNWGTINWSEIVGIPEGFADGVDNEGAGSSNSLTAADGSPSTAVYVDEEGRVGIGTTDPRTGLDITAEPFALLISSDHDINWPSGEALSFNEYYTSGGYSERMRIKDDGTIHLYGGRDGHLLYIHNDGDGGDEDGIYIELGDYNPDKNNNYVTFADKDGDTIGRIEGFLADEWSNLDIGDMLAIGMDPLAWATDRAIRDHGVVYATGNGDYAEYLPKLDSEEEITPYDIVGVHGGFVSRKTEGAQMFMVVSLSPAIVGNMPPEGEDDLYEPIAFLGQVPVKVAGKVSVGDYILPSGLEDGTGIAVSPDEMTVEDYTRVVGVAWSGSDSEEQEYILCAVGLNTNDVAELLEQQENQLTEQQQQIEELRLMIESLAARVEELEKPR